MTRSVRAPRSSCSTRASSRCLKKNGVKVSAKQGAKHKGGTLTLAGLRRRVSTRLNGKGTIDARRLLVFSAGKRNVPLQEPELKAKKTPLLAKVGGSQLKVATREDDRLQARKASAQGFNAKGLVLTQKVATRLNKKLDLEAALRRRASPSARCITKTAADQRSRSCRPGKATFTPDPSLQGQARLALRLGQPDLPGRTRRSGLQLPDHRRGRDRPQRLDRHAAGRRRPRIPPARRRPGLLARTLDRPRRQGHHDRSRRRAHPGFPGQAGPDRHLRHEHRRRRDLLRSESEDDLGYGCAADPAGADRSDLQPGLRQRRPDLCRGRSDRVAVVRGAGAVARAPSGGCALDLSEPPYEHMFVWRLLVS